MPDASRPTGAAFAECLARRKAPGVPSDLLGAEFEPCHAALRQALMHAGVDDSVMGDVLREVEALEAEVAAQS